MRSLARADLLLCRAPFPGHVYYFLEDVYPGMTRRRPLRTPAVVKALCPGEAIRPAVAPRAREEQEERPHFD